MAILRTVCGLSATPPKGITMTIHLLPAPAAMNCPDWCERTDHDADEVGPDGPPVHSGPDFGMIATQDLAGEVRGCLGQLGPDDLDDLTPAQLRALSADALAAAEWIEAHR